MTHPDRVMQSDYMHFAKLGTRATYNLATSGIADCLLSELDLAEGDLALHGPSTYGYGPLVEHGKESGLTAVKHLGSEAGLGVSRWRAAGGF